MTVETMSARDETTSNATRLMCAGAYLNAVFRKQVIRELVRNRFRVVAPSYGYDAVAVLGHAVAARNLRRTQLAVTVGGAILLFVLALAGVLNPFAAVVMFVWLAWAAVYLRRLATLDVLMSRLKVRDDPRASFNGQYPRSGTLGPRLVEKISREQVASTGIVHYGGFKPFVGAGEEVRDWTNAELLLEARSAGMNGVAELAKVAGIDIQAASDGAHNGNGDIGGAKGLVPFTVADITDYVHEHLLTSLRDTAPEDVQITALTVERRQYRRSVFIAANRRAQLRDADAHRSRLGGSERYDSAREYLCVQVGAWDQELITSMFVGFDLKGKTLHSEFYTYLLKPINSSFHLVDSLPDSLTPGFMGRVAWEMVKGIPGLLVKPFVWLIRKARNLWRRARRTGLAIDTSELRLARYAMGTVNTGAVTSIREMASDEDYHHFFQQADRIKYTQVVERTLLQIIRNFLKEHNVDLGDHDFVQNNILSHQDHRQFGGDRQYGDRTESGNITTHGNKSFGSSSPTPGGVPRA
jgi:hypothetical protein